MPVKGKKSVKSPKTIVVSDESEDELNVQYTATELDEDNVLDTVVSSDDEEEIEIKEDDDEDDDDDDEIPIEEDDDDDDDDDDEEGTSTKTKKSSKKATATGENKEKKTKVQKIPNLRVFTEKNLKEIIKNYFPSDSITVKKSQIHINEAIFLGINKIILSGHNFRNNPRNNDESVEMTSFGETSYIKNKYEKIKYIKRQDKVTTHALREHLITKSFINSHFHFQIFSGIPSSNPYTIDSFRCYLHDEFNIIFEDAAFNLYCHLIDQLHARLFAVVKTNMITKDIKSIAPDTIFNSLLVIFELTDISSIENDIKKYEPFADADDKKSKEKFSVSKFHLQQKDVKDVKKSDATTDKKKKAKKGTTGLKVNNKKVAGAAKKSASKSAKKNVTEALNSDDEDNVET